MEKKINIDEMRQKLETELEELCNQIQEQEAKLRQGQVLNPDRSDLAQDFVTRERRLALLNQREDQLEQVKAALQRIEAGMYGICTHCGEPIALERLEILPYAPMCMECTAKHS